MFHAALVRRSVDERLHLTCSTVGIVSYTQAVLTRFDLEWFSGAVLCRSASDA